MTGALQEPLDLLAIADGRVTAADLVLKHREALEKLLCERPERILESPTPSFPQMTKEKGR